MDAKTRQQGSRAARRAEQAATPRRRLIAVGKRQEGRWTVRTSLWRYLAATALSQ